VGNGTGAFVWAGDIRTPSWTISAVSADFNGDGKLDVAAASGNQVNLFMGNGDGTFEIKPAFACGSDTRAIAAGDLNADGVTDIAVTTQGAGVTVFLGRGDGTFAPGLDYMVGPNPYGCVILDVNSDGRLDIAVAEDKFVHILLGNGDGTFVEDMSYPLPSYARDLASGDFDRDGTPDLAVNYFSSNIVTVLMNVGRVAAVSSNPSADPTTLLPLSPNPARGRMSIPFSLHQDGPVRLSILDLQGRSVSVLADGPLPAGRHQFNWDGASAGRPPGVYYARLEWTGGSAVRRFALLR
jgi:hypothetical protein